MKRILFVIISVLLLNSCISEKKQLRIYSLEDKEYSREEFKSLNLKVDPDFFLFGRLQYISFTNDSIEKIVLYHANGTLDQINHSKNGDHNGKQIWYYNNGQKKVEYFEINGQQQGFRYDWSIDGRFRKKTYSIDSEKDSILINVEDNCNYPLRFNANCQYGFANSLSSTETSFADSVYCIAPKIITLDSAFTISVVNTTKDTLYLYSERIKKEFLTSVVNHRLDTLNNIYHISFLPTFWKSRKFTSNPIFEYHYDWNNFTQLYPNSKVDFELELSEQHFLAEENAIVNFCPTCFDEASSNQLVSINPLEKRVNIIVDLAIYPDVSLICCSPVTNDKYVWRLYNAQLKSFEVISKSIEDFKKQVSKN